MALLLLYERDVRGQDSSVRNYVSDLMAINIDTPVEWSQEQVKELQYSHLEKKIMEQKASWQGHYDAVKGASEGEILREGFMWAMQAVRSRAFSGPWAGNLPPPFYRVHPSPFTDAQALNVKPGGGRGKGERGGGGLLKPCSRRGTKQEGEKISLSGSPWPWVGREGGKYAKERKPVFQTIYVLGAGIAVLQ